MAGGYTADSAALEHARSALEQSVRGVADSAAKLESPSVSEAGFGQVHGRYFGSYSNGITQLSKALSGYVREVESLAGGIGQAGQMYSGQDATVSQTIQSEGGDM